MTQISLRVDENVKHDAEMVCDQLGISISSAINIYLNKLGGEKRIPFEVSLDPLYSEENMERLRKSAREIESSGGTIH